MLKFDVSILGGGFSGMLTAINLLTKNPNLKIVILERLDRLGKKINLTGNGRGNISNSSLSPENYFSKDPCFANHSINKYGYKSIIEYFNNLGILTCNEDGKLFPASFQANSIGDIMRFHLDKLACNVYLDCLVNNVSMCKTGYQISTSKGEFLTCHIVFAMGGMATKKLGCDGLGYKTLLPLGYKLTELSPSLVQLKTKQVFHSLKGIKTLAKLSLVDNASSDVLQSYTGDLLFTDVGISGNAVFAISGNALSHKNTTICAEFLPNFTRNQLIEFLQTKIKNHPLLTKADLLNGVIHKQIGFMLLKNIGETNLDLPCNNINLKKLVSALKNFEFTVIGSLGFEFAQVTKGGISTKDFESTTMQSKIHPNLYCIGEMLDVDGECGGYNLHWAYATSRICSDNIIKNITKTSL